MLRARGSGRRGSLRTVRRGRSCLPRTQPLHAAAGCHSQANWLRAQGVGKSDYVAIYMPMILELPYAMVRSMHSMHSMQGCDAMRFPPNYAHRLHVVHAAGPAPPPPCSCPHAAASARPQLACARIGAVHAVVFGGFSAEALAGRIEGCKAKARGAWVGCSGA